MKRRELLSGIAAFLGFGLVEKASNASPTKEKAPKWREEIEKESYLYHYECLKNIAKAHEILKKYSDFTTAECAAIRKTICKKTPENARACKEYRTRFVYESKSNIIHSSIKIPIWDAICVTFRTGGREDGFALIDCEFPKSLEEAELYKDIASFKRISIPLINKVYPTLII